MFIRAITPHKTFFSHFLGKKELVSSEACLLTIALDWYMAAL